MYRIQEISLRRINLFTCTHILSHRLNNPKPTTHVLCSRLATPFNHSLPHALRLRLQILIKLLKPNFQIPPQQPRLHQKSKSSSELLHLLERRAPGSYLTLLEEEAVDSGDAFHGGPAPLELGG